jgi:hypothetical protein
VWSGDASRGRPRIVCVYIRKESIYHPHPFCSLFARLAALLGLHCRGQATTSI